MCAVHSTALAFRRIYHELAFHEAVKQVVSHSSSKLSRGQPSWFAVRTLSGVFTFDSKSLQAVGAVRTWPCLSSDASSIAPAPARDCAAWGHILACPAIQKPRSVSSSVLSVPSMRQVVRFAASGVYTMASAAAAGAAAAAPALDAVRAAAGAALSKTTDSGVGMAPGTAGAVLAPAAGYTVGSAEGADSRQLHSSGPTSHTAPQQPEEGSMGSMVLLSAPAGVPLAHWGAHSRPIACAAFSPSGRLLATADETGQAVKVWRIPDSVLTFEGDSGEPPLAQPQLLYELDRGVTHAVVTSVQFAEDESCVFVSSERGTVHVFCIDPLNGGCPKPPVRVTSLSRRQGEARHPADALADSFVRVVVPAYVLSLPDNPLASQEGGIDGEHTVASAASRVYLSDGLQPPPAPPLQPASAHVRHSSADSSSSMASLNDARRAAVTPPLTPSCAPSAPFLSTCVVSHGGQVQHEDGSSPWQLLLEVWTAAVDHAATLRAGGGASDAGSAAADEHSSKRRRGPSGEQVPSSSTLQKAKLLGHHTLLSVLGGAAGLGTDTPFVLLSAHRVRTSVALGRFAATALQQQVSGAFLSKTQAIPVLAGSSKGGRAPLRGAGGAEPEGGEGGGYGYQPMASSTSEPEAKPDGQQGGAALVQWGLHAAVPRSMHGTISPSAYADGDEADEAGETEPALLGVLPLPSLQRGVKGATHTATAVAAAMANTVQWAHEAGSGSVAALTAAWGSAAGALRGAMGGPPHVPDTSHMSVPVTAASSVHPPRTPSPASSAGGAHPRTRTASFLGATVGATWLAGDMARELRIRQGRWLAEDVQVDVQVARRGAWWVHPWAPQVRDAVARSALPNSTSPLVDASHSMNPGAAHSSGWRWWGGSEWHLGAFGDVSCDPFFSGKGVQGASAQRLKLLPPACFDSSSHSALLPGRTAEGSGDPFGAPGPRGGAAEEGGVPAAVCWGTGGLVLSRVVFPLSAECRALTPLQVAPGALPPPATPSPEQQSANLAELWTSGIGADPAAVIALTRPSAPPAALPEAKDMRKAGAHLARGTWAHVAGTAAAGGGSGSDGGHSPRKAASMYPAVPSISFSEDHFTAEVEGGAAPEQEGTPPPSMAFLAARLEASARAAGRAP